MMSSCNAAAGKRVRKMTCSQHMVAAEVLTIRLTTHIKISTTTKGFSLSFLEIALTMDSHQHKHKDCMQSNYHMNE